MGMPGYDLKRFLSAQAGSYETALRELRAGRKQSHWMWFIFPQLKGLGRSATARRYALGTLAEARAYLEHPVLGPRLETCTQAVLEVEGRSAEDIFGYPDYLKFRSSVTLIARLSTDLFTAALNKYYGGEPDEATLRLLREA